VFLETALKRAIQRNVEKLKEEQLTQDYNTYYYPEQRYHFEKDDPKAHADFIYLNDDLLGNCMPADS
jgi:uridine kinase